MADLKELRKENPGYHIAYADGSVYPNPNGHGGVGVVVIPPKKNSKVKKHYRYIGGGHTNNTSELNAIKDALGLIPSGSKVLVRTDSTYSINVLERTWSANVNVELIEGIIGFMESNFEEVIFEHVKGHNGDHYNEIADQLASRGRKSGTPKSILSNSRIESIFFKEGKMKRPK